jgi:hypothetical protein
MTVSELLTRQFSKYPISPPAIARGGIAQDRGPPISMTRYTRLFSAGELDVLLRQVERLTRRLVGKGIG